MTGTVYLLHFDVPVHHARHYLGWTGQVTVEDRVQRHLDGRGSPLVAAADRLGDVRIARVWYQVDRNFERRLKKGKETPALCPVCSGKAAYNRRRT